MVYIAREFSVTYCNQKAILKNTEADLICVVLS